MVKSDRRVYTAANFQPNSYMRMPRKTTFCEISGQHLFRHDGQHDKGFELSQNFGHPKPLFSFDSILAIKRQERQCSIIYDAASKSDTKQSFAVLIIIIFGTWTSTLNYFDFDLEILRISKYYIQTSKLWLRFSKSVKYTSKLQLRNTLTPVMQKLSSNPISV